MTNLYCYMSHRAAVSAMLQDSGYQGGVTAVSSPAQLRGLPRGTFVRAVGHETALPHDFYAVIAERGMLFMSLARMVTK